MKEQGQLLGEPRGLLSSSLPEPPRENTEDSPQGWCNPDACVMAGKECSATPQLLLPHGRSSAVLAPKLTHFPETRTAIPSSSPFSLLALILAHPSLLILFLLPSAYLHLPPVPHPMGNATTFVFLTVSKPTSASPLSLLQLPLQTLPLETQSHPTGSFYPLHLTPSPSQATFLSRVLFSFSRRLQ